MEDPILTLHARRDGGTVVIEVAGEVDMTTAPQLAEEFSRALAEDPSEIELDCTDMTFLDSSGIKVLIQAWTAVRERVGETTVYVTNLQRGPARTLEACGVSGLLTR